MSDESGADLDQWKFRPVDLMPGKGWKKYVIEVDIPADGHGRILLSAQLLANHAGGYLRGISEAEGCLGTEDEPCED